MTLETSSSVEIPLPEDDPVGMSMLCHIIHLRNNAIAHKPDVGLIHKVATLADKYDCAEAVKHAAWSWISQHLGELIKPKRMSRCTLRKSLDKTAGLSSLLSHSRAPPSST